MDGKNPLVPPPPPAVDAPSSLADVTIRTMAGDLDSLMKSGGTLAPPKIETISIGSADSRGRGWGTTLAWTVVVVFLASAFFFAGYYYLPLVFKAVEDKPQPEKTLPATLPTSTSAEPVFFGHKSFFRIKADATVRLPIEGVSGEEAAKSYSERLALAIKGVEAKHSLIEIEATEKSGTAATWPQFSYLIDTDIFGREFSLSKFGSDFTFFVFRNQAGSWPGYILATKEGVSLPEASEEAALKIENSTSVLSGLFMLYPGNASGTFITMQVVGQPVRALDFTAAGAAFHYGWFFNRYLIMSTSEEGLREAVRRL